LGASGAPEKLGKKETGGRISNGTGGPAVLVRAEGGGKCEGKVPTGNEREGAKGMEVETPNAEKTMGRGGGKKEKLYYS